MANAVNAEEAPRGHEDHASTSQGRARKARADFLACAIVNEDVAFVAAWIRGEANSLATRNANGNCGENAS